MRKTFLLANQLVGRLLDDRVPPVKQSRQLADLESGHVKPLAETSMKWEVVTYDEANPRKKFTMIVQAPNEEQALMAVGRSAQFFEWFERHGFVTQGGKPVPFQPFEYDGHTGIDIGGDDEAWVKYTVVDTMTGEPERDSVSFKYEVNPAAPDAQLSPFTRFKFLSPEQREAWEEKHLGIKLAPPASLRIPGPPPSIALPSERTWKKCPKDIARKVSPGSIYGLEKGLLKATVNDIKAVLGFEPEDWRGQQHEDEGRGSLWQFLIGDVSLAALARLRAHKGNPFLDQTKTVLCSVWDYNSFYTGEILPDESPKFGFFTYGPHEFYKNLFGKAYKENGSQKTSLIDLIKGEQTIEEPPSEDEDDPSQWWMK